jgi:hypothetical protein
MKCVFPEPGLAKDDRFGGEKTHRFEAELVMLVANHVSRRLPQIILQENTALLFSAFPMFVPSLSWQNDTRLV